VNDREVEQPALVKLTQRAGKNPVDAAIGLPSACHRRSAR